MNKTSDMQDLLPWYVNGTLEPGERRRVEQALAGDASLQAELARLQRLGALVTSEAVAVPAPAPDGFARLLSQMLTAARPQPAPSAGWTALIAESFAVWSRPAVLAGLAVIVILEAGGIVALLPADSPQRFVTASAPQGEGLRAVVLFKPETTLLQIRIILDGEQATIVRGPTPDGSVVVQWAGLTTEAVDSAIKRLRASPEFVLRAERGT